jgi:hypothetical protein
MFNGRDLTGWVNANCAPETWSFTNGVVYCTGRPTGAMRTERQYENFIMEAEWRHLSSGGNSGIFIWGTPIAAPAVPFLRGIEVQVLDHGYSHSGKNEWYTTHGDVFPIHGARMKPFGKHNGERSFPSEERSKPSPEWNHYRIVATNGVIRLSVNGKEVSGGEECNYRKGYLALESEGAPVEFRNVRIKELPSSHTSAELTAPVDEGFRTIFNGLDLRGWRTDGAAGGRWAVEGERLRLKDGEAAAGGALLTEKSYTSGEFIVDIARAKEAKDEAALSIHGQTVKLKDSNSGNMTRYRVTFDKTHVLIRRGDAAPMRLDFEKAAPGPSPIGLIAVNGAATFMNLYAREVK